MSRLWAWFAKLPPAETYHVVIEKNLAVPMLDEVTLLADHYFPRTGGKCPTILIRTPYGRANFSYLGRLFAERGFQVLLQSCRGTYGSGGEFHPFLQEHVDDIPTVEWIKRQAWFNGELALHGASYMGYVQWPIAAHGGPELKAMAAQMTSPDIRRAIFPGESLSLDIFLNWAALWSTGNRSLVHTQHVLRHVGRACNHLPLHEADVIVAEEPVRFWRELLERHEPQDDWWKAQDYWNAVPQITTPVSLFSGWYAFFLPDIIGLYQELRRGGGEPFLLIGPWAHSSWQLLRYDTKEALSWFRAHLLGDRSRLRSSPVHIYIMGANEWRDYPQWPPIGFHSQRWHLQSDRGLTLERPAQSDPDSYRYDPANPTPAGRGSCQRRKLWPKGPAEVRSTTRCVDVHQHST